MILVCFFSFLFIWHISKGTSSQIQAILWLLKKVFLIIGFYLQLNSKCHSVILQIILRHNGWSNDWCSIEKISPLSPLLIVNRVYLCSCFQIYSGPLKPGPWQHASLCLCIECPCNPHTDFPPDRPYFWANDSAPDRDNSACTTLKFDWHKVMCSANVYEGQDVVWFGTVAWTKSMAHLQALETQVKTRRISMVNDISKIFLS